MDAARRREGECKHMAVNRVPVLKRCRSLGLEPAYLGYSKKSKRKIQNRLIVLQDYLLTDNQFKPFMKNGTERQIYQKNKNI